MAEPFWLESVTKLGVGGVIVGVTYMVTPLLRDVLARKNGNGATQREALRDVIGEQLMPAINRQSAILDKQTDLLTRLVTLEESRERRGE